MKSHEKIEFINTNFYIFSSLPGSQHIASRSSALNLLDLLLIFKPKSVLDWGTGIGTLIPLYNFVNASTITAVEKNEWCRSQFITNTVSFTNVVLKQDLPIKSDFDFVCIDDEINLKTILFLVSRDCFPKVIFVEGWRNRTVAKVSFIILLLGLNATFARGKERTMEFQLSSREKSGSYFVLTGYNRLNSIASWVKRCLKTHEFREFRNFLMKSLGLFKVLRFLNLGGKIRKMVKLKSPNREKYWRRELW